jgi:hypothetical protein
MPKYEIATWSFGDRDMEFRSFKDCDLERQDISSQELSKSRNAEMRNCDMEFQSFGDCDMELQDISSQELSKSRNAKM